MSRINLSRIKKLEAVGNRVTDFSYMTDEQLFEALCDNNPAIMSSVMPAFRAGGFDAGVEQLYRMLFSDDPEKLAIVMEADRRGDCEAVASMLEERYAREI